jgi:hypothetical protein
MYFSGRGRLLIHTSPDPTRSHSTMHSLLSNELYRVLAADRVRNAPSVVVPVRRTNPPPIRGRVAYVAARLARRLDSESARKAVA